MTASTRSFSELALPLTAEEATEVSRVGSKAANEAVLRQAGFPVPDGFVLTTDAFSRFLAENAPGIESSPEDFEHAPMPDEILAALGTLRSDLGDGPVAVRSSAVAEDMPEASFAGLYETVLNVEDSDDLEAAIRHCWASAFNHRVSAYRQQQGLSAAPIAVLIQQMVLAESAGVAFTANPVTGRRDEVLINAVSGLGERLVSGQVTPDEWTVVGRDARCTHSAEDAITAAQAIAIAELARRAEAHFGSAQDIEWAIADEQGFLLQARPITTLSDGQPDVEMVPIPVDVPPGYWFRNAGHQPQPLTPMHNSVFRRHMLIGAKSLCDEFGLLVERIDVQDIGGWEYGRFVPFGGSDGSALPGWMMWLLVRVVPSIRRRLKENRDAVRGEKATRVIRRWYDEDRPGLAGRIANLRAVDLARLSDDELDSHLEEVDALFIGMEEVRPPHKVAEALILYDLVNTCRELLGWDEADTFELLNGTSFQSTEPARKLNELVQRARARPHLLAFLERIDEDPLHALAAVDAEFGIALEQYIEEYGCRALRYEVADPTLGESPELVLELIRGQIVTGHDPAADEALLAEKRAERLADAQSELSARPEDLVRFNRVLDKARLTYPVREDSEYYCVSAPVALLRYAVLELGSRLEDRGVLAAENDVFFLSFDEAREALFNPTDHGEPIKRRKGERAWAAANPGPSTYGTEPAEPDSLDFLPREARVTMEAIMWYLDPDEDIVDLSETGPVATGTGVSPGEYTGPARVIMHEGEFDKLQPGDVLVCPTTSPVWSVLFPSIGALVTDHGGMLSHPAIIAREYRVPAVLAVGNITSRVEDGQVVTVDGTTGHVELRPGR